MEIRLGSDLRNQIWATGAASSIWPPPIFGSSPYFTLEGGRFALNATTGLAEPVSNLLPNGLQVAAPDFGNKNDTSKYLRNYTTLYRRPVPIKIQFLLGMFATPRQPTALNPDTHRLQLGITPSVTLWNPNNVPVVMNYNPANPYLYTQMLRLSNTPFLIR